MLVGHPNHGRCKATGRAVAFVQNESINFMRSDKTSHQRDDVRFRVLRLLERRPNASQREIAEELGVSLGTINFCMKALIQKGHLKVANFKASKNKLGYIYVLTPEGIAYRAQLTAGFIHRKMVEFEAIRAELEQLLGERSKRPCGPYAETGLRRHALRTNKD